MKLMLINLILIFIAPIGIKYQNMDLEYIRLNYESAIDNKELCRSMMEALISEKKDPVQLAYLSGLQTLWANHTLNPFAKLETFKKGRINLEKALKMAPNNLEIRFIRLSVQKNAPRFLGYYKNIEKDEEFLKQHQHSVSSAALLQLINKLLLQT